MSVHPPSVLDGINPFELFGNTFSGGTCEVCGRRLETARVSSTDRTKQFWICRGCFARASDVGGDHIICVKKSENGMSVEVTATRPKGTAWSPARLMKVAELIGKTISEFVARMPEEP